MIKIEQHICKIIRADEYEALTNSTYLTYLLVKILNVSIETTGGYVAWLNGED